MQSCSKILIRSFTTKISVSLNTEGIFKTCEVPLKQKLLQNQFSSVWQLILWNIQYFLVETIVIFGTLLLQISPKLTPYFFSQATPVLCSKNTYLRKTTITQSHVKLVFENLVICPIADMEKPERKICSPQLIKS